MLQNITKLLENIASEIGFKTEVKLSRPLEKFGDYSTNLALEAARHLNRNPNDLAKEIIEKINISELKDNFESIDDVNGFINFKISNKGIVDQMLVKAQTDNLDIQKVDEPETVIIEYFQNNVAKPPHVGHLRSAVVGDSLARIYRELGHRVISDTHIGDWGTQFGILIYAFKTLGNRDEVDKDPINELNKLYVEMSRRIEDDPQLREKGKEEFKKLEDGDEENRQLWQWFVDESMEDFERYQKLLGLLPFDYNLGESFYQEHMPQVVDEFKKKGLTKTGETGELYVDLEEYNLGRCILIKSDGATTYHLRDFATYIYRKQEFMFNKALLVVDNRQAHHFRQLNKVLELAGYPAKDDYLHIELGFMSLPEGPISTRKGNIISLEALVSEAAERSRKIIEEKNPDLLYKDQISQKIGIAAIKYFDLSHNRKTEIIFDWDKALSFEGNTGPYMQYTYARIQGILRKAEAAFEQRNDSPVLLPAERSVIRHMGYFEEIICEAAAANQPNIICDYLFELSQKFNSFYQSVQVLSEPDAKLRNLRLNLCHGVGNIIKKGLDLLGIEAPDQI